MMLEFVTKPQQPMKTTETAVIDVVKDNSCFHKAAELGHLDILKTLLETGEYPIDFRDSKGRTVLDVATSSKQRSVIEYLLGRDDWQLLMKPTQKIPFRSRTIARETPFRQLMKHCPDLALIVLNKCIIENPKNNNIENENSKDIEKEVKDTELHHVFENIDDTYMILSSNGEITDERSSYYDPKENPDKKYQLRPEARDYHANYGEVCKQHPLQIMVDKQLTELLLHPVTQSLIDLKWKNLDGRIFYSGLIFYSIFLMMYTLFVSLATFPYERKSETRAAALNSAVIPSKEPLECMTESNVFDSMNMLKYCIVFLSVVHIIREVVLFYIRRQYLAYESVTEKIISSGIIDYFVFLGAIYTVIDIAPCAHMNTLRTDLQWKIMSQCILAAWLNLIILIRHDPCIGIYVLMFVEVLRAFAKFSVLIIVFVLAFSSSFFVLMKNKAEFATLPTSVQKTASMMLGDLDFDGIFQGEEDEYEEQTFQYKLTYTIYVMFCVIMPIVLINLIGIAVEKIKEVNKNVEFKRISMQVKLVLQIESPMVWLRRRVAISRRIYTDKDEIRNIKAKMETDKSENDMQHLLRVFDQVRAKNEIIASHLHQLLDSPST